MAGVWGGSEGAGGGGFGGGGGGGAVKLKASPVDVAGLGHGAYWVNLGSSAFPVIELNVFRGKREWLVFSSGARTLDKNVVLAGLTKIAKATVAR